MCDLNLHQDSWESFLGRSTETLTPEPCPGIDFRAQKVFWQMVGKEESLLESKKHQGLPLGLKWFSYVEENALGKEIQLTIL